MTKKAVTRTEKSKAPTTEDKTPSRIAPKGKQDGDQGIPIEHFHGEKTDKHIDDEGDLDEETLDRNAPYNRTYGREDT